MIQLYQGAHAIILPADLALKIVFCYHKSGKYVNAYLDGWWQQQIPLLQIQLNNFLKQYSFNTGFSVPSLPMFSFTKSYFSSNFQRTNIPRGREGLSNSAQLRIYTFFVCVNVSVFLKQSLVSFLFFFQSFLKLCESIVGFYIVHFFLNSCYVLFAVLKNDL